MNNNIALNATNPRLTGNVKIVLDSEKNIFFESINSSEWLSQTTFKGYKYNKALLYRTNLRNFINQSIGISRLYDVVDTSYLLTTNDLYQQHHYLYDRGCYSEDSQFIDENFRYFAPIHISDKANLPSHFVIIKTNDTSNDLSKILLNDFKIVETFDLSEISERIFSNISESGFTTDLKTLNLYGFDIENATNATKHETFNHILDSEQTITETNNWITNAYKRHSMLYGNIVNMEFAFTDKEVDGKFVRYFGAYVNMETIDEIEHLDGSLRLISSQHGFIDYDKNHIYKKYFGQTFSITGSSFGIQKQAVLDVMLLINPAVSTILQFLYNDEVDCTLILNDNDINSNVDITRRNIARKINNEYNGNNTTIRAEVHGKTIRFITNNILDELETIQFVTSSTSMKIQKSIYGSRTNEFIKPNENSILSNTWLNTEKFAYVKYVINNVEYFSKIRQVDKYLGQYLFTISDAINILSSNDTVWLVEEKEELPVVCSFLQIGELDMNTDNSNYANTVDFNKNAYKSYLLNEMSSSTYIGSALRYFGIDDISELTSEMFDNYKTLLTTKIEKYFEAFDDNDKTFVKSINTATLVSEMVTDPYERFDENMQESLRKRNRLYPFISKWSCGKSSSNNDNIFNVALPWKHESLNASHVELNRNQYKNTHDWFVLIDGLPMYDLPTSQRLSFSLYSLDLPSFENTEIDAYDFMQHIDEYEVFKCFSILKYDNLQQSSFVFFKGVKYRIGKNVDNYKFSVVMKTSTAILDDVFKIEIIQNDKFKTYTIFINFYIPEPILTTLDRDDRYYFIDKSLMYYSNDVYESMQNSVDFGIDRISIDLYNSTEYKKYLGNVLPHRNWWHVDNQNETILYVKRGNSGIFGTTFTDILSINSTFSIRYTESAVQSSPFYGMEIEFVDIVEIGEHHFWCKQIIVKYNTTDDIEDNDNIGIIDDNVVNATYSLDVYDLYLSDPLLFYHNNAIYMSKSIAYELCYYDKVLTSSATNARYNEMSLANMKQFLKSNTVKSNKGFDKIDVEDSNSYDIAITNSSVFSNNNQLYKINTIQNQYTYTILRQNVLYQPLINNLLSFYDFKDSKNIFPLKMSKNYRRYKKIVSKIDNEYLDKLHSKSFVPSMNLEKHYDYVKAFNSDATYVSLPWLVSPEEIRTPISSYVMNTSEKIVCSINQTSVNVNLVDLLKSYILQIVDLQSLNDVDLNAYINIANNSDISSISNYDVRYSIIDQFIRNVFMNIYHVESVVDVDSNVYQFVTSNSTIMLNKIPTNLIKITFTR